MTFSEFGRRPEANASGGTDHGTSSALFVIGENVKGGFYGASPQARRPRQPGQPDGLGRLPQRLRLGPRRLAGRRLRRRSWAGPTRTSGCSGPSRVAPTSPPGRSPGRGCRSPRRATWSASSTWTSTAGSATPAASPTGPAKLTSGTRTIVGVIDAFLHSTEFGRSVAPVARLALAGFGGPPAFDDLMAWAAQVKAGTTLATVAARRRAPGPAFADPVPGCPTQRSWPRIFPEVARPQGHRRREVGRSGPPAASGAATRAGAHRRPRQPHRGRAPATEPQVEVLMTYAGLLRRTPDASGWTYWVGKVRGRHLDPAADRPVLRLRRVPAPLLPPDQAGRIWVRWPGDACGAW